MFPNLEAEMARRKITQATLAAVIGVTPTTMSMKLSGKAPITLAEADKIRDAIDRELRIDYLFSSEISKA